MYHMIKPVLTLIVCSIVRPYLRAFIANGDPSAFTLCRPIRNAALLLLTQLKLLVKVEKLLALVLELKTGVSRRGQQKIGRGSKTKDFHDEHSMTTSFLPEPIFGGNGSYM